MIIKCRGYRYSSELVHIMVDKITDFVYIDYNGRSGTRITLVDGREVLVAEYPNDVYDKIMAVSC